VIYMEGFNLISFLYEVLESLVEEVAEEEPTSWVPGIRKGIAAKGLGPDSYGVSSIERTIFGDNKRRRSDIYKMHGRKGYRHQVPAWKA
jgi:hypothetical protein